MSPPAGLTFLGWDRPALPSAVAWLCERFSVDAAVDLSEVLVVVPGRQAGRRLTELLIDATDASGLELLPPLALPIGELPRRLFTPPAGCALAEDPHLRQRAWVHAVRSVDESVARHLLAGDVSRWGPGDWQAFGAELAAVAEELLGEGLAPADLAGNDHLPAAQRRRWSAFAAVFDAYRAALAEADLIDPHQARLDALSEGRVAAEGTVVLLGTVDPPRALRRMLAAVADAVEVLVFAPQSLAERFDEWGFLRPEAWSGRALEIPDPAVVAAEGPEEQALAVAEALEAFGREGFAAGEVTVALPEESLAPAVGYALDRCGVAHRATAGRPAIQTAPAVLLAATAEFLREPTFESFGSLVRHADLHRLLTAEAGEYLGDLDLYHARHLSRQLPRHRGEWLGDRRRGADVDRLERLRVDVLAVLGALARPSPRPLGEWVEPIAALLEAVYGDLPVAASDPAGRQAAEACAAIAARLEAYRSAARPPWLSEDLPPAGAIDLLLGELAGIRLDPPPAEGGVTLAGWLELPLDDAAAVVVTQCNEGALPQSLSSHAFLPEALRKHLGLATNARRYARDAYALSAVLACRRHVRLIVAATDAEGNPLAPSRLLLGGEGAEAARRLLRLEEQWQAPPRVSLPAGPAAPRTPFVRPPAELPYPHDFMNASTFGTYLKSPYQFYLQYVLELEAVEDSARDVAAPDFGTVAHAVLERFGREEKLRDSTDADRIEVFLYDQLAREIRRRYGPTPPATVDVQMLQLQRRLRGWAAWQARRRADGWRIAEVELKVGHPDPLPLATPDGGTMGIRGKIDRIDVHDATGVCAVMDYKTGEQARTPNQTHRRGEDWIDLQLPLYHLLARDVAAGRPIRLGYVLLPREPKRIKEAMAEWDEDLIADALAAAGQVAQDVREGRFDEVGDLPSGYDEIVDSLAVRPAGGRP